MIPKKYSGDELRNKFCRPVRKIRNGGGAAISPETICRIVSVVRGHGFTIETEKCPRCGQSAYISRVSRDDLELIENPMMEDLVNGGEKSVEHLQSLCDKLDQIIHENDGCNCCNGDEALFYQDSENCAFVDSHGEIMVMVKDHVMRFKVDCCPKCGRKFDQKEI